MIGDYRFFQEFFDGQIVKPYGDKYNMFKRLLISCFSVLGLFFVFIGLCNVAEFILLELGMIWNFYTRLDKKISIALALCVGLIYCFFAANFAIFSNCLVYLSCYIPLQLIATSRDYSEGDFIQIKKHINEWNKILFYIFVTCLLVFFILFDVNTGARFIVFDALSATFLLCSAVLRNERYVEYYVFRIFALVSSILLWILVFLEYGATGVLAVLLMYTAYLIFDVVTYFVQQGTYINQYMIQVEKHQHIQDQLLVQEKLKVYNKTKKAENKK